MLRLKGVCVCVCVCVCVWVCVVYICVEKYMYIPFSPFRNHGDLSNCRKLLQRSVNSASDEPEKVCQALLRFEREVGTLETFESALERCATQLRRVEDRRKKV